MLLDFGTVLLFVIVAVLFVFVSLFLGKLVRPHRPYSEKNSPYECGEPPIGSGWLNWNMRFYVIALIFVIFDVEIAFLFPVAVLFRDWVLKGEGWIVFGELMIFAGILFLGLVYLWKRGDLEWIRDFVREGEEPIRSFRDPLPPSHDAGNKEM